MLRTPLILGLAVICVACTTNPYTHERQASNKGKGAAIGAAVGAVLGVATGDDADERRKRALIGAGVGALTGTAIGHYMDAQEAKLREQLRSTGVSVTRVGDELILNMPSNITFDVNEYQVKGEFKPVLNSVGLTLQEFEQTLIDVRGHTDSTGSFALNQDLSEKRAASVATYLEATGIEPLRMEETGLGPNEPVADNTTREGRALNRRVELVLKPLS